MTAEIIQFTKRGERTPRNTTAKHGALIPSDDGARHYIPIWPGEENDWARDGYTMIGLAAGTIAGG